MKLLRPISGSVVALLIAFWLSEPGKIEAAPVILQATAVVNNGECHSYVFGDNFSFSQIETFGCSSREFSGAAGVLWPTYQESNPEFDALVVGYVNVPENPGRLAVAYGGQYGSTYVLTNVTVPDNYSGSIPFNVVLNGTLQVCLLPASAQTPNDIGPCDPAYADFATINVNVAGQNVMNFNHGLPVNDEFVGTAAAAPEPANLEIVGCGALLVGWLGKRMDLQKTLSRVNRLSGM